MSAYVRPKLTHAQARDLMFAADLLLVDADEYEINARQRAVLRNSRSAIAAALEVQATRRAEREAAAEAARVERELRRPRWDPTAEGEGWAGEGCADVVAARVGGRST